MKTMITLVGMENRKYALDQFVHMIFQQARRLLKTLSICTATRLVLSFHGGCVCVCKCLFPLTLFFFFKYILHVQDLDSDNYFTRNL